MRNSKRVIGILLSMIFVFLSVTGLQARTTGAYFSHHEDAKGSVAVKLQYSTELKEEVSDGNKTITVKNTGECDVWVRVGVFVGNADYVEYVYGDKWENDGDFFYYTEILPTGASTDPLKVNVKKDNVKDYQFEIIVVQECERVTYNGDTPVPGFGR